MIGVRSTASRLLAACRAIFPGSRETIFVRPAAESNAGERGAQKQRDQTKLKLQKLTKRDYVVEEWIGGGSMGDVFRVKHKRLQAPRAIKVLAPHLAADNTQLERFFREAKIGANLQHPNFVPVLDYGHEGDFVYLVMNYIAGKDLETLGFFQDKDERKSRRSWNPPEVVAIALQVAQALEFAHEHNIIHRDLKPSNICIDHYGNVFVLDFGIAGLRAGSTGRTLDGELLGTPLYMSPEQAAGEPADARSDLYSLGVIMYEMLAGSNPFDAENPQTVLAKRLTFDPPALSTLRADVPAALSTLIRRLLARDPDRRYQNAADLRRDLAEIGSKATRKKKKGAAGSPETGALAGLVTKDSILHRNPQVDLGREFTPVERQVFDLSDGKRSIDMILEGAGEAREEIQAAIDTLRRVGAVYIGIPGILAPSEVVPEQARPYPQPLLIAGAAVVVAAAALATYFVFRGPTAPQMVQVDASPFAAVTIRTAKGTVVVQNDTPFQTSLVPGTYTVEFVSGQRQKVETITVGAASPGLIRAEFWGKEETKKLLDSYR